MAKTWTRSFEWRFDSPPEALWPALSDTARFNEAAGIPKHAIEEVPGPDGTVRFLARARRGPLTLAWEEVPVEWVDGQWFRHLRVFSNGPLESLCATLRLQPDGDGAVGHYTVEVVAANPLGTLLLATAFFPTVERIFGRLARGAGEWAAGRCERPYAAPPLRLGAAARARIDALVARLEESPNGHGLGRRLVDWLLAGQEVDVMRLRPLALARRWGAEERHVVEMCLQAVKEGLLQLRWDLLCPRCRGAKLTVVSLDRLPSEAHCGSCNIAYDRDFARNVELTFSPAPALREVADGEFCLFGPMTTPHVKVQAALEAGESRPLEARIEPGEYRLRTLESGGQSDIDYAGGALPAVVARGGTVVAGPPGAEGELRLVNEDGRRRTLIVESREWVRDALSAHRATTLQSFRDLFAGEAPRLGDEIGVSQVALMFTDLAGSTALYERVGDGAAYRLVRAHFAFLARVVREHDGAIVKTIGDAVMAAFADPGQAMRAALAVQREVAGFNADSGAADIVIKLGLHAGACVAVTLNERLDYFGSTVNLAARLQGQSRGGDIVLSETLAADPAVAELLASQRPARERAELRGFDEPVSFLRLVPTAAGAA